MKRFVEFLLEASEGDARKYMKKVLEAMPDVLEELIADYGEAEWVNTCFNKIRSDFVHAGCDVLFVPGIARIAYGELDYDSEDEDTTKITALKNIAKFITTAHKDEFSRNLEHIVEIKEGPKKGSKERSKPMTFEELNTMFSRNIAAITANSRSNFENDDSNTDNGYTVIWLKDFETAHKYLKYVQYDSWCYFENTYTFENYTHNGNKLYLALAPGFEKLKPGDEGYGRSMIGFDMGPQDENGHSTMEVCNNRYNHGEDLEHENDKTGDAKYDELELSKILGVPVWKAYPGYSAEEVAINTGILTKALREKYVRMLKPEMFKAFVEHANNLHYDITEIGLTLVTIPYTFIFKVLELNLPNNGACYANVLLNDDLTINSILNTDYGILTDKPSKHISTYNSIVTVIQAPESAETWNWDVSDMHEVFVNGESLTSKLPANYTIKSAVPCRFSGILMQIKVVTAERKTYNLLLNTQTGEYVYTLNDKLIEYSESFRGVNKKFETDSGEIRHEFTIINLNAKYSAQAYIDAITSHDDLDEFTIVSFINSDYDNVTIETSHKDFKQLFIARAPKNPEIRELYRRHGLFDILDSTGKVLFTKQVDGICYLTNDCIVINNKITSIEESEYFNTATIKFENDARYLIVDINTNKTLVAIDNIDTQALETYTDLPAENLYQVTIHPKTNEINVFSTSTKSLLFKSQSLFAPVSFDSHRKAVTCKYAESQYYKPVAAYIKPVEDYVEIRSMTSDSVLATSNSTDLAESVTNYLRNNLREKKKVDYLAGNKQACINELSNVTTVNDFKRVLLSYASSCLISDASYKSLVALASARKLTLAKELAKSMLSEAKILPTLAAAGAIAAGAANANTNMQPLKGHDVRYGGKTPTEFHVRLNHDLDADDYNYKVDKLPDNISFAQAEDDSADIDVTVEKILATPDTILTKYGKNNTKTIASAVVKASKKYDIDENILLAILSSETGFDQNAKSWTGVKSIAQITATTYNSLHNKKNIDAEHTLEGIHGDVTKAIYAAANIIDYMSTHMHGNIEMIFAEYNGGATGGASPYRMYRQGISKDKIIAWMQENKCSQRTIKHFFEETIPYVAKCMKMYHYYLDFDQHYED